MNILRRNGAKHGVKIQAWDMELLSRILAHIWFCMDIRPKNPVKPWPSTPIRV